MNKKNSSVAIVIVIISFHQLSLITFHNYYKFYHKKTTWAMSN
jgi:hypothetical protein